MLAEAAALGAAILDPAALAGIVDRLTPDDFDLEGHRAVYVTLVEMHAAGVAVDQITLSDALVTSGRLDVAGGLATPFDLASLDACPTPSAWPVYAGVVAREADRRRFRRGLARAAERLDQGDDPAEVRTALVGEVTR